ncbi:MAG TPA: hypothetical protein VJL60_04615, partial [Gammaproteobacteria bacterium]|nr:hypothetical protein [Gammaproteobacteria bacterium]
LRARNAADTANTAGAISFTNASNQIILGVNLTTTGNLTVSAQNITGNINAANLFLNTTFANLNGFVGGSSGQAAINKITLSHPITPGTHFFDGIDMFSTPPIPTPAPTPTTPMPMPLVDPLPIPSSPMILLSESSISQSISSYLYSEFFQENNYVMNKKANEVDLFRISDNQEHKHTMNNFIVDLNV